MISTTDIDNFRDEAVRQLRQHFEDKREQLIEAANAHIECDGDEACFAASFAMKFDLGEKEQNSKFSFPPPKIVNELKGHLHLEDEEQMELPLGGDDEREGAK